MPASKAKTKSVRKAAPKRNAKPVSLLSARTRAAIQKTAKAVHDTGTFLLLHHDQIVASKDNPRTLFEHQGLEELSQSIVENGLIEPLLVRPEGKGFKLIAGERRFRAIGLAIKKGKLPKTFEIGCVNRPVEEAKARAIALVENLQRVDLTPLEEANALAALQKIDPKLYSSAKLATMIGKTDRFVEQRLALVKRGTPALQKAMADGKIDVTQARELTLLPGKLQEKTLKEVVSYRNVSSDQVHRMVQRERIPLGRAMFDLKGHEANIVTESDGKKFFLGIDEFNKLQEGAIKTKIDALRKEWNWVERRNYFSEYGDEFETRRERKDKTKAGVVIVYDSHAASLHIEMGLVKKKKGKVAETPAQKKQRELEQQRAEAFQELLAGIRQAAVNNTDMMQRICLFLAFTNNLDGDYSMALGGRFFITSGEGLFDQGGALFPWRATFEPFLDLSGKKSSISYAANPSHVWQVIERLPKIEIGRMFMAMTVAEFTIVDRGEDEMICNATVAIAKDAGVKLPPVLAALVKPEKPTKGAKLKKSGGKAPKNGDTTVTVVKSPADVEAVNERLAKHRAERQEADDEPRCRECGCTEAKACVTNGVPCHWIEPDLCSACHAVAQGDEPKVDTVVTVADLGRTNDRHIDDELRDTHPDFLKSKKAG